MRAVLSEEDNAGRLRNRLVTEALPASNIPFMRHLDVLVAEWPPVPPEAVSWMLPELEPLARDMAAAILSEVPEYGRPDDDSYARVVHQVARDAVHQFAARIADPAAPGEPITRMFHDIGRVEAAAGRSLDALHTALRIGARVTWQRLREKARQGGGDADVFARLGESIFRYLDELAAACSAGYAEARAEFAGEAERLRHRLLDLLVADPPTPPEAIASLAATIGWRLPRRVVAVALTAPAGACSGALTPLPPDVLVDLAGREPCVLMPDPDGPGRRRQLEDGLRKWPVTASPEGAAAPGRCLAAIGPAVPPARAGASLRWARRALSLAQRNRPARPPTGSSAVTSSSPRWCCWPTPSSPACSAARRSRRCAGSAPSRPTGWRRRCSRGWRARTTPGWRRAACTSTRRPCATACGSSPSCSATASTTPMRGSPSRSPSGSAAW